LKEADLRYITALTDPQIRKLLKQGTLQMGLFEEKICEVEAGGLRYVLRKNPEIERKEHHRVEDKLAKLTQKVEARNQFVTDSKRAVPESGLRQLEVWIRRHKLQGFVRVSLKERRLVVEVDEAAQREALLLAGCYVIETDVPAEALKADQVHDRYKDLAKVERDWRSMKTGFLEIRPVFLRKANRTRAHALVCMLALKIIREMERRLTARFGTTDTDPHAVTLPDALAALNRSVPAALRARQRHHHHPASPTGRSSTEHPGGPSHHLTEGPTDVGRTGDRQRIRKSFPFNDLSRDPRVPLQGRSP
jgi:hypothetical protein